MSYLSDHHAAIGTGDERHSELPTRPPMVLFSLPTNSVRKSLDAWSTYCERCRDRLGMVRGSIRARPDERCIAVEIVLAGEYESMAEEVRLYLDGVRDNVAA